MKEIEVKIYEIDAPAIRKRLQQLNAKLVKDVLQHSTYFANNYTKRTGASVRVRKEGDRAVLTVKSPRRFIRKLKVQEEHEFEIPANLDADMMFNTLGLQRTRYTQMKREYYALHHCSVEICQLPGIPAYLEIEGSEDDIIAAATLLGFTQKDFSTEAPGNKYNVKKKSWMF